MFRNVTLLQIGTQTADKAMHEYGLWFDWSFTVVCINFSANNPLSVTAGNRLRNISTIFWQTQFSSRVGNAVLPTTVGKSSYHFLCIPLINKSSFTKQVLWHQHEGCNCLLGSKVRAGVSKKGSHKPAFYHDLSAKDRVIKLVYQYKKPVKITRSSW